MISVDERAQLNADLRELEIMAGEYSHESAIRFAFLGFAAVMKNSFELTLVEKLALVVDRVKEIGPCTRGDLVERLPFVREESRRLVDQAIDAGMVESFVERTEGRPAKMLRSP